ncbi:MAG: stage II sporulation protein M [Chloroflexota bacterium]
MNIKKFVESRQHDWKILTQLLDKSQRNIEHLSPEEVKHMGVLYRAVTSDLALAQRDFPRERMTLYLNQLVARGHAILYQSEPLAIKRLINYVSRGFPQTFRATWPFFLISFLLFMVPALITGFLMSSEPEHAYWLMPAQAEQLIPILEESELWIDVAPNERPIFSSFIMTNNIRVAILAFAGGAAAGLFALFVLVNNGLVIGGTFGLAGAYELGFDLFTFAIGHGVIELTTIFIAGAAGLQLGWGIINPGLLNRRDSMVLSAQVAMKLIVGCIPLLVIAGLIEGFISPNDAIPVVVKWLVGIVTGIMLYSYLLLAGRGTPKN